MPQLTGNSYWKLDEPGDVVAKEYRVENGTFHVVTEFSPAIGDPQDLVVRVGGIELSSGDRTALDYSYIRVSR